MTNLEIEAFLAIVRAGSITKAAGMLYVTQPALSRRMKSLESELGYALFERKKGVRSIELTKEGKLFIPVAEKWQFLWRESVEIRKENRRQILNVASVDSVGTYIMPEVYQNFLLENPNINLGLRMFHSYEAYSYMEEGIVDLAFISDDRYSKNIRTIPAFTEKMVFVCSNGARYPQVVHPSVLDVGKQIKLPWNPEYESWHEYWFGATKQPRVFLDKMSLMEQFMRLNGSWAIVPQSAALGMLKAGVVENRPIEEGPADRICYYLIDEKKNHELTDNFLSVLNDYLHRSEGVVSLLTE